MCVGTYIIYVWALTLIYTMYTRMNCTQRPKKHEKSLAGGKKRPEKNRDLLTWLLLWHIYIPTYRYSCIYTRSTHVFLHAAIQNIWVYYLKVKKKLRINYIYRKTFSRSTYNDTAFDAYYIIQVQSNVLCAYSYLFIYFIFK